MFPNPNQASQASMQEMLAEMTKNTEALGFQGHDGHDGPSFTGYWLGLMEHMMIYIYINGM